MTDNVLSANIYAAGLLDDLIARAIAPFWHEAKNLLGERFLLWLVRYSRRGEHLKVRVHGDPQDAHVLKELLTDHVRRYLHQVGGLPAAPRRAALPDIPAIDPEDEIAIAAPDRSLMWTTYQRSAVTMASPWLDFEGFAERSYKCMARACEWVLFLFEESDSPTPTARQKLLIEALVTGLPALGLHGDRVAPYLRYHRDWLLRFLLRDADREETALHQLSRQVGKRSTTVDQIRRLASSALRPPKDPAGYSVRFAAALSELSGYLESIRGLIDRDADPFASDMAFPPVFKVMHNLANQCGLPLLEEAYIHHLVFAAMSPEVALCGVAS